MVSNVTFHQVTADDGLLMRANVLPGWCCLFRVQFHRPELLTEVVPDVDVMPCDPRENVPLITAGTPMLLNGRSTVHSGGGAGPLARAKARAPGSRLSMGGPGLSGGNGAAAGSLLPPGMVPVTAGNAPSDVAADAALVQEVSWWGNNCVVFATAKMPLH
jgi:hypothetical protein